MKTTKKCFDNIQEVQNTFRLFADYIENHEDGSNVRESQAYKNLKIRMMKLQQRCFEDTLI